MILAALLLPLLLAWGCGPIEYVRTVAGTGRRALREAKAAEAEKRAPYDYWTAVELLEMAREKGAYADFQLSIKYGELAIESARRAKRLALMKRSEDPSVKQSPGPFEDDSEDPFAPHGDAQQGPASSSGPSRDEDTPPRAQ